jgi:hypothetical protein
MRYSEAREKIKDPLHLAFVKEMISRNRVAGHATRTKDRLFKKAVRPNGTKGLR